MYGQRFALAYRALAALALLWAVLYWPLSPARGAPASQTGGTTLSVVSGTAAVLRADGTRFSPAPNGLVLEAGDQVATLRMSRALINLFDGSEVELGSQTTFILRELERRESGTTIAMTNVVGTSVHRVAPQRQAGSIYRVESGQTVTLVHGTVFGHAVDPDGDVTVALDRCDAGSNAAPAGVAECLEFPGPGQFMRPGQKRTATDRGDVVTDTFNIGSPLLTVVSAPAEIGSSRGTDNPGLSTGSNTVSQRSAGERETGRDREEKDPVAPAAIGINPECTVTPTTEVVIPPIPGVTRLRATALAGSTRLEVASAGTLGFALGDLIEIDPGGSSSEVGQIANINERENIIELTAPLQFNHPAGTVIRLPGIPIPAVPTPISVPTTTTTSRPC